MPATYTPEQIAAQVARVAALNQMIADGVRQVTIGEQTITYNTTDSLMRARDDAQSLLNTMEAGAAARRVATRSQLFYAGRGY